MQLFFIRHAQSTNNALWDTTGASVGRSCDPDLTSLGREQARLVARFIARANPDGGRTPAERDGGFGLTHLYTSLMMRAVATAWEISQASGLPLEALYDIYEEGGIYLEEDASGRRIGQAGQTRAFFEKTYPGIILPADFPEGGWWNGRPHEDADGTAARAAAFLASLVDRHGASQDRVGVVSHGAFFNYLVAAMTGRRAGEGFWYVVNNTGISRFDFASDYVLVTYLNRTDHLPGELLT
ncbi:MAG TPA: histidine phosphatase family protein [Anaerolineaceae bacterium]|jgi:2,3-bisphosphoglycerate-dependent phosphoglycerate mutase